VRTADRRVVSQAQIRLLHIVGIVNRTYSAPNLRLEGGTALAAYHLRHRESEDLEFFAEPGLNAPEFGRHIIEQAAREGVLVEEAGPASLGFARLVARDPAVPDSSGVRVDLAVTSAYRLEPLEETAEGIQIASYRDLCAGKLHATCDRFEPRDFVDLHAILHFRIGGTESDSQSVVRYRIRSLVEDVMQTDPGLDPHLVGQAIQRGLGQPLIERLPLRLLSPIRDAQLQETIRVCVDECALMVRERILGTD
jgi:hypothetical protein